jgi:hypothetical protein
LLATIYDYRPDLFNNVPPIENHRTIMIPELASLQETKATDSTYVANIGATWNTKDDPTGWLPYSNLLFLIE